MNILEAKVWEDGMRTDPTKKSFEWWYFDANLDDGSTIVITFFTKSPAKAGGPPAPQIQIVVTKPDGHKLKFLQDFSYSEFKASKEKCDVVMGKNSVSGNLEKYTLRLAMAGIAGEIEFERIAQSYSTNAKGHSKPEYFGWFCAIPYGTVKGKVTYENKERAIKGTGYHDHNWGIINLNQVCQYWYWGRGNAGDYSLIFTVMVLPKILGGKHVSMLYLAKGKKAIIEDSNHLELTYTDITPEKPSRGHLPKKLTFTYQGECNVVFTLTNPELIELDDALANTKGISRFLAGLRSKQYYVRYNADIELSVESEGKTEKYSGNGLYEIMILH
jgi:hypothetical protein